MSFSFRDKFAKAPGGEETANNNAAANATTTGSPKKGKKFNPLLSAKTEDYADDIDLCKPKISRQERYDYYQELLSINKDRKNSTNLVVLNEIQYYPKPFVWAFAFIRSNRWDQWYLNWLLLFFVMIIFFTDEWAKIFAPFLLTMNDNNQLLMIPLALMLVCQVIPLFGTIFFVHFCNDLVRLIASQNFQQWAFVSCLTAQYIEYFYYGGRDRRDKAGKIRRGEISKFHQMKVKMIEFMERFTKKGARIQPEGSQEGESAVSNESNSESDDSDEDDEDEDEDSDLSDEDEDEDEEEDEEGGGDDENAKKKKAEKIKKRQEEKEKRRKEKELKQKEKEKRRKERELRQKEKEKEKSRTDVTIKVSVANQSVEDVETGDTGKKDRPLSPAQKHDRPSSANAQLNKAETSKEQRPKSASKQGDINNDIEANINDTEEKKEATEGLQEGEEEEKVPENPEDYMDWICMVCQTPNHGLKHNPNPQVDIYFGEKGALYRRMYANLVFHSPKPACKKCFTLCDYKPPPGSAHIFPHNPEPHVAFRGYPKKHILIHGLETEDNPIDDGQRRIIPPRYTNMVRSFFFGKKNDPTSVPMENDWRLKKYILHHFPKIPKYELKPEERYEVGEIIECRQQKSEFCRARVLAVHGNDTYDIKYDGGDECRFVLRKEIRLGTEKRSFAYRVEMMAVILTASFPLCLMIVLSSSDFGLVFLTMFVLSLGLLVIRLKAFCQYAYNYIDAGICVIFRFTLFFTLPLFFFFLTSVIGVTSGKDPANWVTITALAIMTKLFSLPVLYTIRPVYAVLGLFLFLQTSIGMLLLTIYCNTSPSNRGSILIPIIPFITTILTLKYLRMELHNVWDTCFVIRPRIEDKKSNPSIFLSLYKRLDETWSNIKANYF